MAKDPLALSAMTAGPPHEAEYDAVYAAVAATERGRWFLTEYANRNRHADTHLVVAAIARIETAIRGDAAPQSSAALWRDLTGIAATVEQIRAAFAAEQTPAPDIGAALERIQGISFGLRERAVDSALCDALDAAARGVPDAWARREANGKPAPGAAALLRELAGRVDALIGLSLAGPVSSQTPSQNSSQIPSQAPDQASHHAANIGTAPSVATVAVAAIEAAPAPVHQTESGTADAADDDELSRAGLFAVDLAASKKPTEAVATLATSLANAAAAIDPQSEPAATVMAPPDYAERAEPPVRAQADDGTRWQIEAPDFVFHPPDREANKERVESSGATGRVRALLPEAQFQPGPEDDPADLFEVALTRVAVAPGSAPTAAAATPAPAVAAAAEDGPPAAVPPPQLRIANGPTVHAIARPAPSDPLAAIRGLSDEELTALFG